MTHEKQLLPYGTWPSPITPTMIGQGIRLNDVQWAPNAETLVWSQSLSGQTSLFAQKRDDAPYNLTVGFNPSGGVGYGGGEFDAGDEGVVFVDKNGRLYFKPYGPGSPHPLTPAFGSSASPTISPDGKRVLYVNSYEGQDVLATADLHSAKWPQILAEGADFYMQPTWSPDGKAIAWVEWDHPNMPWDGTRLRFGLLDESATKLIEAHTLDGNADTPTFQPLFSPDGTKLAYLRNEGEWDQLLVLDLQTGQKHILVQDKSLLPPAWVQGMRAIAWSPDSDTLYYFENNQAVISLCQTSLQNPSPARIDVGAYTHLSQLSVSKDGSLAVIAESPQLPARVLMVQEGKVQTVVRAMADLVEPENLPDPQSINWQSSDGMQVYGTYYPPTNKHFKADGVPPVVVYVHGGPTSQTPVGFNLEAAFFTSRGYGYFVVNYRGSTGYGRTYRNKLRQNWGKIDLQDSVEGAQALVQKGLADPFKLIIKGGSAGGYTVLNALIHHPGFFKAGLCSYGVSNLFTMDMDTHKFEAHYNASLIGKLPEAAQRYHDWSPIFHADKIRDAIAIFQGTDDKVVPQDQSDSIVEILASNKVPHTYRLYPGEGHGFRKTENLIDFYQTTERFLRQHVIFSL